MDFARQSTLVLLQPDCRRAGRSHLIKASILATLPARSVAYNCQGALLEHPVLETLLPLLLCNTSSARSRVQDVLGSKGEAAGACCAMEGEAACLPAISGRCCPTCESSQQSLPPRCSNVCLCRQGTDPRPHSVTCHQELPVPCSNLSFFCLVWFSRVYRRELHGQELPRPSHAGA